MQLDEARASKQEIIERLTGGISAAAADPGSGGVFVGIAPSDQPGGFRVAIRLTGDGDAEPTERIDALRASAGPEADIRYVGRVRALSTGPDEPPPPGPDEPAEPVGDEPTATELQQRLRPLVRGASIAHVDVTAGTLGAFVTLAGEPGVHVLSNNHVLEASDRGQLGDAIVQPGPYDGGTGDDRVGTLAAAVAFEPAGGNLVDAALARLVDGTEIDASAHDGAVLEVVDAADVTGTVRKIGRTTGVTRGRISAFEVDGVPVGYDTGTFVFDDQVEIEGVLGLFSDGGDSGSVITTEGEPRGVALLFAGSTTGGPGGMGVTYANPLATVLEQLGATLTDGSPARDAG